MQYISSQILILLIFLSVVLLHIIKKNSSAIRLYAFQSLAVTLVLITSYFETGLTAVLVVATIVFVVKVVIAPTFFFRLIRRHEVKFSGSTYLNTPVSLIGVAILTSFTRSEVFNPLRAINPINAEVITLATAVMLVSFFLIINRRGAISQMIGILSLENGIVAFAVFSGLEQSPTLQIGILFDIIVWIIIASIFASMIYKHFGSLDVSGMSSLTE